jgi:integrase
VSRSPVDGLDPSEQPRPRAERGGHRLDETQLAALVRHAPSGYRAIVTLLAFSGLRVSEALGLRWRNVRLVDGELDIREQLQAGRGARETKIVTRLKSEASYRTVPIFPAVAGELATLLEERLDDLRARRGDDADLRKLDDELVFRSRTGQPLSPRNVAQRGVTKAATNAGSAT